MDRSTGDSTKKCNILLIGETGSGKSTLVNYLANYFLGGSIDPPNLKIAIPTVHHPRTTVNLAKHTEQNIEDQTKSKTGKCNSYNFVTDGVNYAFIDSPGLSDTGGRNKDTEHINHITYTAEKIGTIAAIVLVISGMENRLKESLRTTIDGIRSFVPNVLLENVIVLLTKCDEITSIFELKTLPWAVPKENVFLMNNCAFTKLFSNWTSDDKLKTGLIKYWGKSMTEIGKMISRINQLEPAACEAFGTMQNERTNITNELKMSKSIMNRLYSLHKNLCGIQKDLSDADAGIIKHSNYTVKKNKEIIEKVTTTTKFRNIICSHCNILCCSNCQTDMPLGALVFCSSFTNSQCNVCGCNTSSHIYANYRLVKKNQIIDEIDEAEKALFNLHTEEKASAEQEMNKINDEIQPLNRDFDAKVKKIQESCKKLKIICTETTFSYDQAIGLSAIIKHAGLIVNIVNTDTKADAQERLKKVESLTAILRKTS